MIDTCKRSMVKLQVCSPQDVLVTSLAYFGMTTDRRSLRPEYRSCDLAHRTRWLAGEILSREVVYVVSDRKSVEASEFGGAERARRLDVRLARVRSNRRFGYRWR